MEFARFEWTDAAGATHILAVEPRHVEALESAPDRHTAICTVSGARYLVAKPEYDVIAELQRAAEADREPDDEGPYRMKLDGSHRARGTYYPGFEDAATNLGVWSGPLPPLCSHSAKGHLDGLCAEAGCACMGWPTIAGWHSEASRVLNATAENPGA